MLYVQPADVVVGEPDEASNQNAQNTALANINARLSGIEEDFLPNGGFEYDLDSDNEPDNWSILDNGDSGAYHEIDSTTSHSGTYSLHCVITASGGYVEATNDSKLPCSPGARIEVPFAYKTDDATARVRVDINWYDSGLSSVSTSSIFDSSASNPSSWTLINGYNVQAVAPATTAWYEVVLTAGESGNTVDAGVWFDSVRPRIYHGFVPVDPQHASNPVATNLSGTKTLPAGIIGLERPISALLRIEIASYSGSGTSDIYLYSESGGTAYDWYQIPDITAFPFTLWRMFTALNVLNSSFYITETSAGGNPSGISVYLVGYHV